MSELELNLSHLDFHKENVSSSLSTSTKNHSQTESRPNSFHALLSQNEDLAARLRVTLQRLANTEEQNERLAAQSELFNSQYSAFEDQILIWKEKEKIWKNRELQLEKQFHERERELDIESSLLRQKVEQFDNLEDKLGRYQKYQEKIKTSVKPYIAQLKSYAQSLLEQTRTLNQSILQKEMIIQDLEVKLYRSHSETDSIGAKAVSDKNQLISLFEDERENLRSEIDTFKSQVETLQEKTRILDRSLERQDELENLVVALRRTKDDLIQQFARDTGDLRKALGKTETDLTVKTMQAQDLEGEIQRLKASLQSLTENHLQAQEQLTSLRYMWTQKTQECDRLKMTAHSLEKINLELSQKLNSLRQDLDIS